MSYSSGEAAEQVVRMTLNGVEVAAKISGKAAERLAVLLYAVLKDQKKTRGKTRLNSMLRSGKELKVFAIGDRDLEKFCREAKKYGILYCVLKDKTANDGHTGAHRNRQGTGGAEERGHSRPRPQHHGKGQGGGLPGCASCSCAQ